MTTEARSRKQEVGRRKKEGGKLGGFIIYINDTHAHSTQNRVSVSLLSFSSLSLSLTHTHLVFQIASDPFDPPAAIRKAFEGQKLAAKMFPNQVSYGPLLSGAVRGERGGRGGVSKMRQQSNKSTHFPFLFFPLSVSLILYLHSNKFNISQPYSTVSKRIKQHAPMAIVFDPTLVGTFPPMSHNLTVLSRPEVTTRSRARALQETEEQAFV